jgi:hypothetical protein
MELLYILIIVVSLAIIIPLAGAMLAPNPPFAYCPRKWTVFDSTWKERMEKIDGNYFYHVRDKLYFSCQLFVAGYAGFTHAFFASLVPFVAEEVGVELYNLNIARKSRGGKAQYSLEGFPYAYRPWQWVTLVDGAAHVIFSGGSYMNHMRFACWASGQFVIGGIFGVIHAFIPPLFPMFPEEVSSELGGLIVSRRKLRNKKEGFKNPANLSDMLHSAEWKEKFDEAEKHAAEVGDVGQSDGSELSRGKVKVVTGPNEKAKFL